MFKYHEIDSELYDESLNINICKKGDIRYFGCSNCSHISKTIALEDGEVYSFIRCPNCEKCTILINLKNYPTLDVEELLRMEIEYEWVKPSVETIEKNISFKHYFDNGGLVAILKQKK